MKNFILIILSIVVLISCTKADVLDEKLDGKSYAIDYADIEQQLNYADQCDNCGSARLHAILNWDIKGITFGKEKNFTLTAKNNTLNGTYEIVNGGKDLILLFTGTKYILTFKIIESTKKRLRLDLDWYDTTFSPSSYKLNFYFKVI